MVSPVDYTLSPIFKPVRKQRKAQEIGTHTGLNRTMDGCQNYLSAQLLKKNLLSLIHIRSRVCVYAHARLCMYACMCVCVCVCVRE